MLRFSNVPLRSARCFVRIGVMAARRSTTAAHVPDGDSVLGLMRELLNEKETRLAEIKRADGELLNEKETRLAEIKRADGELLNEKETRLAEAKRAKDETTATMKQLLAAKDETVAAKEKIGQLTVDLETLRQTHLTLLSSVGGINIRFMIEHAEERFLTIAQRKMTDRASKWGVILDTKPQFAANIDKCLAGRSEGTVDRAAIFQELYRLESSAVHRAKITLAADAKTLLVKGDQYGPADRCIVKELGKLIGHSVQFVE